MAPLWKDKEARKEARLAGPDSEWGTADDAHQIFSTRVFKR